MSLCPAPLPLPAGAPPFAKSNPNPWEQTQASQPDPCSVGALGLPTRWTHPAAGRAPCRAPTDMPAVLPAAEAEEAHVPGPDLARGLARGRATPRKRQGPALRTGRPLWGHRACSFPPPHPGGTSKESCKPCPAGSFCPGRGLSLPTGSCAAGSKCPLDPAACGPTALPCPQVPPGGHRRDPRPPGLRPALSAWRGPQHPVP